MSDLVYLSTTRKIHRICSCSLVNYMTTGTCSPLLENIFLSETSPLEYFQLSVVGGEQLESFLELLVSIHLDHGRATGGGANGRIHGERRGGEFLAA